MTKKMTVILLAAIMMFTVVACAKDENSEKNETSSTTKTDSNANYEGSLENLMNAVYEKNPVEVTLGPPMAIELADANNVNYSLGLSDASNIEEAICSEPMIGSQAYSFCLVRAKKDADIDELKQNIMDGIDPRKWICVQANKIIVANYGDVIALIMTDNNLSESMADDLYKAFGEVVDGELGEKLEKTVE